MPSPRRQLIIFLLTAFLGFSVVGGFAFTPKAAHAQWIVSDVGNALFQSAKWTAERLKEAFNVIKKNFADVAFKNALKTYLTTLAEDTATWVASAGTGQKPLFITDPQYFSKLNDAAVGDFLDSLSQPTEYIDPQTGQKKFGSVFGRTLCDPGTVKLQLDLALRTELTPNFCQDGCNQNYQTGLAQGKFTIGTSTKFDVTLQSAKEDLEILRQAKAQGQTTPPSRVFCEGMTLDGCIQEYQEGITNYQQKLSDDLKLCNNLCSAGRRKAKCTFSQIRERVGKTLSRVEVVGNLPKIFKPTENPIGQYLTLVQDAQKAAAEKEKQERDVAVGLVGNIISVRSRITGETLTPADLARAQAQQALTSDPSGSAFSIQTGSPIADAIGVFTNTLTKKLVDRIYRCGLNPALCFEGGGGTKLSSGGGGSLTAGGYNSTGISAARASFASSFTPDLTSNTQVDTLTDLQTKGFMDAGFRDAVAAGMTVLEATQTSPPKLDPNKPFGFSRPAGVNDLSRSVQPDVNSGYSYRSMLYLRKNRIIPVGWEIAAEYIGRYLTAPVSVGKLISCYNDNVSPECKPFYRLVDPNWVLKAPATQCVRKGFGEDIVPGSCHPETLPVSTLGEQTANVIQATAQVCQREETCVDDQSCVVETPDGKGCREYGYCTAEKPIWRFNGTACGSQYNNCQSYQTESGETVSYVKDTLRTDTCSAGNVGCQRYFRPGYCSAGNLGATCTEDADCGAGGTCSSAYDPATSSWKSTAQYTLDSNYDKIFLDKDAQKCSAQNEGCTEFLRTTGGANLARNPSFEEHSVVDVPGGRENFPGWAIGGANQTCGVQAFPESGALFGSTAVRFQSIVDCPPPDVIHYAFQPIDAGRPIADRTFTFSFSARTTSGACGASAQMADSAYYSPLLPLNLTTDWQRFSSTHTFPSTRTETGFALMIRVSPGCDLVVDGVQVEEGPVASSFRDYGSGNAVDLKQPPGYLGCTGNLTADRPECANFALKCAQNEVGCELYTPTLGGGEAVPGKVTNPLSDVCVSSNFTDPRCNQCPAQFVGCQAFQEVKLTNNPPDPNNAVRTGFRCSNDNSRSCTGPADTSCGPGNSCLNTLSIIPTSGRRCSAADVGCEEYTNLDTVAKGGEGKEYYKQVRQCVNLQDAQVLNYYSWEGSDRSGFQLKLHKLKRSNFDAGPCTNLTVSGNANAACNDTAATQASCTIDPLNPDCVTFYDQAGATFDRTLSRTIVASDTCLPYRNTLDTNVYYFDGKLSRQCSAAVAGCREYKGNAGNNIRVVVNDTFEDNTNDGWTNGVPSNESTNFGGHSLRVPAGTPAVAKDVSVTANKAYTISFWAKGSGTLTAAMNTNPAATFTPTVATSGTWNRYTLGPVVAGALGASTQLSISGFSGESFLDNITLTEVSDSVYLIRNSYSFCQGYENCSAYRDRAGNTQFLKSFSGICQAEKVGCEALIDTQNSTSAFEQQSQKNPTLGDLNDDGVIDSKDVDQLTQYTFVGDPDLRPQPGWLGDMNKDGVYSGADVGLLSSVVAGNSSAPDPVDKNITVPADRITYLVNDPAKSCSASEKGCGRFGLPKLDAKGTITSRDTVFLKDNPDEYSSILCQGNQVSCSAYTLTDTQGQAFFKDPGQQVCEYRDNVGVNRDSGYYKVGTDTPCPAYLWPYLCPADQSSCSLYSAPTSYPTPAGGETNYYNLASTVPAGECPQGLDPATGCLAFHTDRENNGINTIRPNVNLADNSIISQSCQVCDPNAATCGRNGGAPCCTWTASSCSIKQSDGADSKTPYYCLYEDSAGQTGCQTTGGKVIPNDATAPTNCGGVGQPLCFLADLSDYDPALRACSDFACTANVVLKVKRDRICGEWLTCTNQQVVTNDQGKQTSVCLERQLCRADPGGLGTCTIIADTEFPNAIPPTNLTVASPADVEKIANLSGYVKAGIDLAGPPTPDVNGQLPQDQMTEEGLAGTEVDVPNADFEAVKITGNEPPNSPPESNANFQWRSDPTTNGATIKLEKFTPDGAFTQQFLRVTSRTTRENGTFVGINRDLFTASAPEYFVTFDIRTVGTPSKQVTLSLRQDPGTGTAVTLWGPSTVTVTETWQRYIVRLPKSAANSLKLIGANIGDVELAVLHAASNVPNESFLLDNVSLKPILKVQASPDTFVARDCRSFPKDSAAECTFTDTQSGVNFAGWKGYCVERDPSDPTKCITWLPIDLIAGEENVFGPADRSLTRSPLFFCAEATPKALALTLPRYVCLSHETGPNGGPDRCNAIAIVNKPRAQAYALTVSNWQLGVGNAPKCKDNGTQSNDASIYGNATCTAGVDVLECAILTQWPNSAAGGCAYNSLGSCITDLQRYWDYVQVMGFKDDGSSPNRCQSDAWQDDGPKGGDDCDDGNGGECKYTVDQTLDPQGAAWQNDEAFPRQCNTLVQVTRINGTSKPWAARVQGAFDGRHPISYVSQTQCSPYGGAPVIQTPNDIVSCIPDPAAPPPSGCSDITGVCAKFVPSETGNCILGPLELYNPGNYDNRDKTRICTETRLGNGFYGCVGGVCRTCITGTDAGLNCLFDANCTGAIDPNPATEGDLCSWQKLCSAGSSRPGAACVTNADCPGGTCAVPTTSTETLGTPTDTLANNYPNTVSGISRLKQLFVQSYGVWAWDTAEKKYVPVDNLDWSAPTIRCGACYNGSTYGKFCTSNADCTAPQTCSSNVRPGLGLSGDAFRAVDTYCYIAPRVTDVKVAAGDKAAVSSGQVVLSGNSRTITLQFSAKADDEQAPIRNVTIDWGDGLNRSGYTGTSATKTYFCAADPSNPLNCANPCPGGANTQTVTVNGQQRQACLYTPTVTARDNWGKENSPAAAFGGSIVVLP